MKVKVIDGKVNIQVCDNTTGEVIDISSNIEDLAKMLVFKEVSKRTKQIRNQVKYYYEGKIMIFQKMLGRARKELNGMELKVFLYFLEIMDFENWIHITQKEMAKDIGIAQRNVQLAIKGLKEKGYIEVIKKGHENYYRVNPELAWKGSEKTHYKELKRKNPLID